MRSYQLIIFFLLCSSIFYTGCEESVVDFNKDAPVSIKMPSILKNSCTSIIATRKDAAVDISLTYFDPAWYKIGIDYTAYPDYYEVYLSNDGGDNWEMVRTIDTSYINKSFAISGLTNDELYYVYLKEVNNQIKETKNTNVAIFIPSSYKPSYNQILSTGYYDDLYTFDLNRINRNIVYATKSYEFKPGYSAASVFFSGSGSEPQLVDIKCWFPAFNSSGSKISYSSDKDEIFDGKLLPEHIVIYDVMSKTPDRITSGYSVNRYPVWSPDNSLIAFSSSEKSDESLRIAIINLETHVQKILQTESGLSQNILSYSQVRPAWSADGKHIYFTLRSSSDDNLYPGYYDIYRLSSIGGIPEPVFNSNRIECTPSISPDNTKLAFIADYNGRLNIWVYNLIDSKFHQTFDNELYDFSEVWTQIKWRDNNTILYTSRSGIYSISVE